MRNQPGTNELDWLIEPPPVNEAHILIALGQHVSVTPQLRQALEALMRALPTPEMKAYISDVRSRCSPQIICGGKGPSRCTGGIQLICGRI